MACQCSYCGSDISGLHVECSNCGKYADKVYMTYTAQTNRIIHKKLKEYYIINKKFLWVNIILIILLGLIGYLIGGLYGSIFGTFTGIVIGIVLLFILPNHKKLVIEIGVPAPLNEDIKRQNPKIEI